MFIARNSQKSTSTAQRRFVSERELSEIIGRNMRTLQKDRLLNKGPFPHYHINRQVKYDLDECIGIVRASRSGGAESAHQLVEAGT